MAEQYFEGIGRRKESTARVRIMRGTGNFTVNEKSLEEYFTRLGDPAAILEPFDATGENRTQYDVTVSGKWRWRNGTNDCCTTWVGACVCQNESRLCGCFAQG
jgi:hypothetical protein